MRFTAWMQSFWTRWGLLLAEAQGSAPRVPTAEDPATGVLMRPPALPSRKAVISISSKKVVPG
jgi:hypothetical protein